jgi:hypothetical protein
MTPASPYPFKPDQYPVVAIGVDTLHYTAPIDLKPGVVERLQQLQDAAREQHGEPLYLGGDPLATPQPVAQARAKLAAAKAARGQLDADADEEVAGPLDAEVKYFERQLEDVQAACRRDEAGSKGKGERGSDEIAFVMLPRAIQRYRWGLHSEEWGIFLWFTDSKIGKGAKVEIGSRALWHFGQEEAVKFTKRVVAEICEIGDDFDTRDARTDFTVDFQGANFTRDMDIRAATRARWSPDHLQPRGLCANCDAPFLDDRARVCGVCECPRQKVVEAWRQLPEHLVHPSIAQRSSPADPGQLDMDVAQPRRRSSRKNLVRYRATVTAWYKARAADLAAPLARVRAELAATKDEFNRLNSGAAERKRLEAEVERIEDELAELEGSAAYVLARVRAELAAAKDALKGLPAGDSAVGELKRLASAIKRIEGQLADLEEASTYDGYARCPNPRLMPHGAQLEQGALPMQRYGGDGRRPFTGWTFGTGKPVLVRLYNKCIEVSEKSPDKVWFYDVWNRSDGYVHCYCPDCGHEEAKAQVLPADAPLMRGELPPSMPKLTKRERQVRKMLGIAEEPKPRHLPRLAARLCPSCDREMRVIPVWRLEVQVRGDLLTKLAPDGKNKISSVEEVIKYTDEIWRLLVGDPHRHCKKCKQVPDSKGQRWRICRTCLAAKQKELGRKLDESDASDRALMAEFKMVRRRGWIELRDASRNPDGATSRMPPTCFWRCLQAVHFEFSAPATMTTAKVRNEVSADINYTMNLGTATSWASRTDLFGQLTEQLRRPPTAKEFKAAVMRMLDKVDEDELLATAILKDVLSGKPMRKPSPSVEQAYCPSCGEVGVALDDNGYCSGCQMPPPPPAKRRPERFGPN